MTYRKDHIPQDTACNRRPRLPLSATTIIPFIIQGTRPARQRMSVRG